MEKYNNLILALFIISWVFTVIFGYIGLFNILKENIFFANILGFIFWVSDGYIHFRAYTAIIEDKNKKQP